MLLPEFQRGDACIFLEYSVECLDAAETAAERHLADAAASLDKLRLGPAYPVRSEIVIECDSGIFLEHP